KFLLLGFASQELIRKSSETLAGRIHYVELTPFTYQELLKDDPDSHTNPQNYGTEADFRNRSLRIQTAPV
ncbi:MAG: hypothetical protein M0017_11600, partial [Desulfobacteraceae bacterium]|nr:hypothetical protein [Desulfobacteraceae bacterium]